MYRLTAHIYFDTDDLLAAARDLERAGWTVEIDWEHGVIEATRKMVDPSDEQRWCPRLHPIAEAHGGFVFDWADDDVAGASVVH
jgi:hypothetical protein